MAKKDVAFGSDTLRVTAVEGTVDVANNRSQVLVTLQLIGGGTFYNFHDGSASVSVNGSQIATALGSATDMPSPGSATITIISNAAVWVNHDANGQATITFSGHLNWPQFPKNVDTGNGSLALSDIIRPPFAPTGVSASRVSDSQVSLSWTNDATNHHGYFGIDLYRSTDDGGYAHIAVVTPGTTSYADTTISAGHKYAYKVEGFNDAGRASTTSSAVWTTPDAPTNCAAAKQGSGDVRVSWSNNVNYPEYTTRVEESTNGGSSWTEIGSVAAGVTSYTHTSPNTAVTHIYRVRARSNTGSLDSSYSNSSNTVTLLANANAPTGLSPSGVARDATGAIVLTWVHNPADGTPQSKYQLQYSTNGGSTWTTVGPTTSSTSSYTLPANTVSNGKTVTWHVATAGQNGTLSSYSANASFATGARPTVNISTPGATYNSSHLTVAWTYFQAQGSAQAAWVARLRNASGTLLEQASGTTETSAVFATAVANGASYTVEVTVTSSAGLDSSLDTQAFTVAYLPPAATVVTAATYDSGSGAMVIAIEGSAPVGGVTEAIDHVDIQRRIGNGEWVTCAVGIVLDPVSLTATVLDTAPTINGTNTYRAVAYSALPSSVMSAEVGVATAEGSWSFLSAGDGFAQVVRMKAAPTFAADASRNRALYHFAGRAKPVQLTGEAVDLALSVSGMLRGDSSTPEEFEALAATPGVVLWREPTGRRVFGSLGQVQTQRSSHFVAQVSFTVTEIDYAE